MTAEPLRVGQRVRIVCRNCDGHGEVPPFEPWDPEMVDARKDLVWTKCPTCAGRGWTGETNIPLPTDAAGEGKEE